MSINADTLFYVVRRLANQMPTRYYLDAKGDGSFSHVALEVWCSQQVEDSLVVLRDELNAMGFSFSSWDKQGSFVIRRWEAERNLSEEIPIL